jgi:NADPH:quinone reductase
MTPTVPDTMTAVVSTPSGERWTEPRELAVPDPAAGEALVAVRAVSVNRGELTLLRMRDGFQPGQDFAGVVVRGAADGSGPQEGERVAGLADWHAWAPFVAVPVERLAAVPDGVDDVTAAALPMAGTTALNVLRAPGGDLLGRRVLITGARGGVGGFAVQLAELAGARVTGVSSVTEEAPDGQDVVLESAGGTSLEQAIAKVAPRGVVVVFGNSSKERSSIDFRDFRDGHQGAGVVSSYSHDYAGIAGENLRVLLDLVAEGRLRVDIGYEGTLADVDDALDAFDARAFSGKAVLRVA